MVGREDEGLTRYSKYLAHKVAASSEQQLTAALKTSKDCEYFSVFIFVEKCFKTTSKVQSSSS